MLANLIASVLIDLAPRLADEVAPGGVLVASGIFRDREPAVREAFGAVGLRVTGRWASEDWVALTVEPMRAGA